MKAKKNVFFVSIYIVNTTGEHRRIGLHGNTSNAQHGNCTLFDQRIYHRDKILNHTLIISSRNKKLLTGADDVMTGVQNVELRP